MSRYWVRWFGGSDGDPRPVVYPTPIEWWCTGTDGEGDVCTICAIVDADDEDAAWDLVRKHWPEARESFCEEREAGWRPPADRFPA